MRLSNIKKVVVSVGLALGLVSGSMVAFGAPSKVITPGQSTVVTAPRGVNAQVIEDGNTRIVIVGEGQKAPSLQTHRSEELLSAMQQFQMQQFLTLHHHLQAEEDHQAVQATAVEVQDL